MTPRDKKIAIPIMAALLLCVAAWFYGFQIAQSFEGISAMRALPGAQGQRLAVVVNNAIHILDDSGKRVVRQDLKSIGLKDAPNDMDWTADAQGKVEAWFFEDSPSRIVRCAWDVSALRLVDCATALSGSQLKIDANSRAIHIAVDRLGNRIFIADARGGAVQQFDLTGKLLGASQASLSLNFPNRLRYLGNNILLVADNDNRRLVWLSVAPGAAFKELSRLGSAGHGQGRAGRSKVQDVAVGPDGTLWMLASRQGQKDGDVLVFDAARKPVVRAELPSGADPLIVDSLAGGAVVADFSLVNLYRLSTSGAYLGELGDAAFRGELAPLQTQARHARWLQQAGWMVGAAVVLLGLVMGLLYGEKPKSRATFTKDDKARIAASAPKVFSVNSALRFPVTLGLSADAQKKMRRQLTFAYLFAGCALLPFFYLFSGLHEGIEPKGVMSVQLGMAALVLLLLIVTGFLSWRSHAETLALKVFESHVELVKGQKQLAKAPLQDVLASPFQVLIGRRSVSYAQPNGLSKAPVYLFDQVLLEQTLLSRLPQKNLVSVTGLGWQQFKNQSLVVRVLTAVLLALGIAVQLWDVWRVLR